MVGIHQQGIRPYLIYLNIYRIMYLLAWRTVYAFTRVFFRCLFPEVHSNEGNKHQNNT